MPKETGKEVKGNNKKSKISSMIKANIAMGAYDKSTEDKVVEADDQLDMLDDKLEQLKELQGNIGNSAMEDRLRAEDEESYDLLDDVEDKVIELDSKQNPEQSEVNSEVQPLVQPEQMKKGETEPAVKEEAAQSNEVVNELSHQTDKLITEINQEKAQPEAVNQSQQQGNSDEVQLAQANAGQETIQTEKFTPVKGTPKKRGWLKKFLHGAVHVASAIRTGLGLAAGYLAGGAIWLFSSRKAQQKSYDVGLIPGTKDNEHFAEYDLNNKDKNQEIQNDVRRVPLVWEQRIPEDPKKPPVISVRIEQVKEGSAKSTKSGDFGHALIALFYSRYDRLSGEEERYKVEYGFYPKGGFTGKSGTLALGMTGLTVPGALQNDMGHPYSVSQDFEVTNDKINAVLAMSENYADGGYSYYDRNCTTFAKDASEAAGINVGDIFEEVDVNLNGGAPIAGLTIAKTLFGGFYEKSVYELGVNKIQKKSNNDDVSYGRYGQKMSTQQDIDNADRDFSYIKRMRGLAPGITGENMRYGENAHIDSYNVERTKEIVAKDGLSETGAFVRLLEVEYDNLIKAMDECKVPEQMKGEILGNMVSYKNELFPLCARALNPEVTGDEKRKVSRAFAEKLNEFMEKINIIYKDTLGSDARLNIPFQHIASAVQNVRQVLYREYNSMERVGDKITDLKNIAYRFEKGYDIELTDGTEAEVTIAAQAAMIQMFGSIEEGINFMQRLNELQNKADKTSSEEKELGMLVRKERTLKDFINAQNSYVNRNNFTQGDMNFAFVHLVEGEKGLKSSTNPVNKASFFYQALAYEKVFGGLAAGYRQVQQSMLEAKVAPETAKKQADLWMINSMITKIENNKDTMQMIVNSFYRARSSEIPMEEMGERLIGSISYVYGKAAVGMPFALVRYLQADSPEHPIFALLGILQKMFTNAHTGNTALNRNETATA